MPPAMRNKAVIAGLVRPCLPADQTLLLRVSRGLPDTKYADRCCHQLSWRALLNARVLARGETHPQAPLGWESITGVASQVRHATTTSGRIQRRNKQTTTTHTMTLRVDGKPAEITLRSLTDVSDGESVSLAGAMSGESFVAYAMRNDRTRIVHTTPTILLTFAGVLLIVAGVPYILFTGVGFLLIGKGTGILFRMKRNRCCAGLLRER